MIMSSKKSVPASPRVATLVVAAVLVVAPHVAFAGDITPVSGLDSASVGAVNTNPSSSNRTTSVGLGLDSAATVPVTTKQDDSKLRYARRVSAYLGLGLTRRIDLSLGVHTTQEDAVGEGSTKAKFSGASALAKFD